MLPQFTATPLVEGMRRALGEEQAAEVMRDVGGKLLTTRQVGTLLYGMVGWAGQGLSSINPTEQSIVLQVAEAGMALLSDPTKVGTVLVVLANGAWVEPQQLRFKSLGVWSQQL